MKKHTKLDDSFPGGTVGIDLGDQSSRYCVLDGHGDVVEEGSFRNQAASIEKHFRGERSRIALEAMPERRLMPPRNPPGSAAP